MENTTSRGWLAILLAFSLAVLSPALGVLALDTPAARPAHTLAASPYDLAFVNQYLQPGRYMPVSEIKPGMVGYGLTVFRGTRVERFNVSIIGVVKKMLNGRDAILARL